MANANPNTAGLKKPWKPGQSGNPNGRPISKARNRSRKGVAGLTLIEILNSALEPPENTPLIAAEER